VKVSEAGIALIKSFESERLEAYVCPAGKWTIGFGHTGPDVRPGMRISSEKAHALLGKDIAKFERCVNAYLAVPVTQNQFDALVSFTFNVGCENLKKSTLLRKLNDGDDVGASEQFRRWDKSNGVPLAGLTRRRQAEMGLFLT
jgi:lysozyme